jgi:predicted secreted hydrolase
MARSRRTPDLRRRTLCGALSAMPLLLPAMPLLLPAAPLLMLPTRSAAAAPAWDPVLPGTRLRFPHDHGAHPGHRIEWWYVTGWLDLPDGREAGFQVTFFRSRTAHPDANPSRFAPRQLILAHAAVALPTSASLIHAERAARAGFDLARAETGDTRVWIGEGADRWLLERDPATDRYRTRVLAPDFELDLELAPDGPPLLQGDAGFSRKGPLPTQASHYYSRPQLAVSGSVRTDGPGTPVTGRGWFDHEWSSDLLDERASGWDWVGLNLDDGTAVMAFRIRARAGGELWRDATIRDPSGDARTGLAPAFREIRSWRSARSGARYPVAMQLRVAGRTFDLQPLIDDQELDSRSSTGVIYWEGAVTVNEGGARIGRGYLELTGYAGPVRF